MGSQITQCGVVVELYEFSIVGGKMWNGQCGSPSGITPQVIEQTGMAKQLRKPRRNSIEVCLRMAYFRANGIRRS